jgi:uncharacterized protein
VEYARHLVAAEAVRRRRTAMSIEQQPDENPNPNTTATTETAGEREEGATESTRSAQPRPRRRGFAAMDRDRVKAIASKGGRAAHAAGTAHQFSSDEARVAGKKGGMAPHVRRGGVRRRPTPTDNAPSSQAQGHGDGR